MNDAAPARDPEGNTRIVHILYILHGLAPFTMWLLAVMAIIIGMMSIGIAGYVCSAIIRFAGARMTPWLRTF